MFEQFRISALAAACLPALSNVNAQAQVPADFQPTPIVSKHHEPTNGDVPDLANSTLTLGLGEWDARGILPVSGITVGVAALALFGIARLRREVNENFEKLGEFDQFVDELADFNALHTRVSAHTASQAVRKGRAAMFPDLPHDYAFEKAWGPLVLSFGLTLKMRAEECGQQIMNGQYEVVVTDPAKLEPLLGAFGRRSKIVGPRLEPSLVVLSKACEEYILTFLNDHGNSSALSRLPTEMDTLSRGLTSAGPTAGADRVAFFRRIYYGNGATLVDYARFHFSCKNELQEEGKYYIFPGPFKTALTHAKSIVEAAAKNSELVPLALRTLSELQKRISALCEYTLTPSPDEPDREGDENGGGGCATATVVATGENALPRKIDEHDPAVLRSATDFVNESRVRLGKSVAHLAFGVEP